MHGTGEGFGEFGGVEGGLEALVGVGSDVVFCVFPPDPGGDASSESSVAVPHQPDLPVGRWIGLHCGTPFLGHRRPLLVRVS